MMPVPVDSYTTGGLPQPSDTEAIAESLVPYYPEDSRKTKYLSFRACGFAVREAIELCGISQRTVMRWRADDSTFKELDGKGLGELRASLSNKYLELEFVRNYRLILLKDFAVIHKAVTGKDDKGNETVMSEREHQYLLKARAHYTPQQLQILDKVMSGEDGGAEFDFTKFILSLSRTADGVKQELRIEGQAR